MSKLAISKAIMDKHNSIGRGGIPQTINQPVLEDFDAPQAKYNLPQDLMTESSQPVQSMSNPTQPPTKDRILNSRLPDEIKRLMIENPIEAKNPLMGGGPVLSDELVEKASKLMGTQRKETVTESKPNVQQSNPDLRKMMKEVVQEVLKENGLIVESQSKANDTMVIKVGQHIFEGKISKVKKLK